MVNPPGFLPQPILPASIPDNGGNYGASNTAETGYENSNLSSNSFSSRLERAQSQQEPARSPRAERVDRPDSRSAADANQTDKTSEDDTATTDNAARQTAKDERDDSPDAGDDNDAKHQTARKKLHTKGGRKSEAIPALFVPDTIAPTTPQTAADAAIANRLLATNGSLSELQTITGIQLTAGSNATALSTTLPANPATAISGMPTPQPNTANAQTSAIAIEPIGDPTKSEATILSASTKQTIGAPVLSNQPVVVATQSTAAASGTSVSTPKNPLAPVDSKAGINSAQGTDNATKPTQILTPKIASSADISVSSPPATDPKATADAVSQPIGSNTLASNLSESKPTAVPVTTSTTASITAKTQSAAATPTSRTESVLTHSGTEIAPDSSAASALSAQHLNGIDRMLTLKQTTPTATQPPVSGTPNIENNATVAASLIAIIAPETADGISTTHLTLEAAAALVPDPNALRLAVKSGTIASGNAENSATESTAILGHASGKSTFAPNAEAVQGMQRADTETDAEANSSGSGAQQGTPQQANAEASRAIGNAVTGTPSPDVGSVTAGTASGSANAGTQLDRAHIVSQVVRHLETMRLQGANDRGEVTLHLTPDRLGSVRMTISAHTDGVTARIAVESSQVQQVLEGAKEHLRGTLESRGLHLGKLEVTVGQQSNPDARNAFSGARDWTQPLEFGTGSRRSSGSTFGSPVTETLMPSPVGRAAAELASESRLDFRA